MRFGTFHKTFCIITACIQNNGLSYINKWKHSGESTVVHYLVWAVESCSSLPTNSLPSGFKSLTLWWLMSYIYGVISSSQRPLPDNTRHSQQTNIHAPGGIRTHDLTTRPEESYPLCCVVVCDLETSRIGAPYIYIYIYIYDISNLRVNVVKREGISAQRIDVLIEIINFKYLT